MHHPAWSAYAVFERVLEKAKQAGSSLVPIDFGSRLLCKPCCTLKDSDIITPLTISHVFRLEIQGWWSCRRTHNEIFEHFEMNSLFVNCDLPISKQYWWGSEECSSEMLNGRGWTPLGGWAPTWGVACAESALRRRWSILWSCVVPSLSPPSQPQRTT